jgi:hypothetical protein
MVEFCQPEGSASITECVARTRRQSLIGRQLPLRPVHLPAIADLRAGAHARGGPCIFSPGSLF